MIDPDLLLSHPAVQAVIEAARNQPQPQHQAHQQAPHQAPLTPQASEQQPSTFAGSTSSAASTTAPSAEYIAARALDPAKMVWTREIAKQQALEKRRKEGKTQKEDDDRYSKEGVMRDHLANPLSDSRMRELDTVARLACAAIDEHEFDPPLPPQNRTWRNLKHAALPLLIKIARRMEAQCQELSFCDNHYKAFLYIEMRLKNKNAGQRTALKAAGKTEKTAGSRRTQKGKQKSSATSKLNSKTSNAAGPSTRAAGPSTSAKETDFSEDSETESPPKKKVKPLTPVEKLNELSKASKTHAATSSTTSKAPKTTVSASKVLTAVFASTSTSTSSSHIEQQTDTQLPNKRPNPTTSAITEYLDIRCGSLPQQEQVRTALKVLQDAINFGSESSGPGKEEFMAWLVQLENLEETPNDEDNHGPSFGHDAIGRYSYRDELKTGDAFGNVRNACRLLAALLKIWTTSNAQIHASKNQQHGPVCGTHIEQASNIITAAFKITSAAANTKTVAGASKSTKTVAGESKENGRNRISKELDSGIVSEAAIRSIQKKTAIGLLERNGMSVGKRQSKEDVLNALVAAYNNNKIKLTAATVKAARANILEKEQ
ncbi:hypothetical protein CF326_g746 [Tilletia indica]|nr:hypothetical protein CF326_g746 [Tilletia indica]